MGSHNRMRGLGRFGAPLLEELRAGSALVALAWLTGAMALGCDAGIEDAADASETTVAPRAAALAEGDSLGVRVRVAGQQLCRGCTRAQVAEQLRVAPRRDLGKGDVDAMWTIHRGEGEPETVLAQRRWIIKFVDDARVRQAPESEVLVSSTRRADLAGLDEVLDHFDVKISPALTVSDEELDALAVRGMRRTLRAQPDLGGLFESATTFTSVEQFLEFGRAMQALDVVEYVEIEALDVPPPGDIPPETDDFSSRQGYLKASTGGVDAPYAWELGIFGQGIGVADCEFSWDLKHEEFTDNPLTVEKGQTLTSSFMDHGTAVMGVTSSPHNGFGVKGIAPKAKPSVYPEKSRQKSSRRLDAVTNAIKDSGKGDIVMLEMQMTGAGGGYGPAEVTKSIWMATKSGTDAGVVVIGAAGNGNQNLDSGSYSDYRSWGDSGLIMVGAGSADTKHSKLSFSTYGKRVDVQGWGTKVATAGYGTLKKVGGDSHQSYSNSFNGTSSATPVVVGAALLVQSYAKENLGAPYTPAELRKLLKETGTKQGGGGNIGPLPNVKAAIEASSEPEENAPEVEITKPNDDVSGEAKSSGESGGPKVFGLRVEVKASDDSKVKGVTLHVDGKAHGDMDKEEPYVFDVELEPGSYKIEAVAEDRYGNKSTSDVLSAKISDPEKDPEPSESAGSGEDPSEAPSEGSQDQKSDKSGEKSKKNSEDSKDTDDEEGSQDPGQDKDRGGCNCKAATSTRAPWLGVLWLGCLAWIRPRRRGVQREG